MFPLSRQKTQDSVAWPIAGTRYSGTVTPHPPSQQADLGLEGADSWRACGAQHIWAFAGQNQAFSSATRAAAGPRVLRCSMPTSVNWPHEGRSGFVQPVADDPFPGAVRLGAWGLRPTPECRLGRMVGITLTPCQAGSISNKSFISAKRSSFLDQHAQWAPASPRAHDPASTPGRAAGCVPSQFTAPRNRCLSMTAPNEPGGCDKDGTQQGTRRESWWSGPDARDHAVDGRSTGRDAGRPRNRVPQPPTRNDLRVLLRVSAPAPTRTDHGMGHRHDFNDFESRLPRRSGHFDDIARAWIRQALSRRAPILQFTAHGR